MTLYFPQAAEGHSERQLSHRDDRPHQPRGRAQGGEQEHACLRGQGQEHLKQGRILETVTLLGFPETHFTMSIIIVHTMNAENF